MVRNWKIENIESLYEQSRVLQYTHAFTHHKLCEEWEWRERERIQKIKDTQQIYTECNTKTSAKCKSHTITHWKAAKTTIFTMECINEYVCSEWKAHSKRRDRRSEYETSIDRTYIFHTILCRKSNNNNQLLRALNDSFKFVDVFWTELCCVRVRYVNRLMCKTVSCELYKRCRKRASESKVKERRNYFDKRLTENCNVIWNDNVIVHFALKCNCIEYA